VGFLSLKAYSFACLQIFEIAEIKKEIRRVIGELNPEMCEQVIVNFVLRTEAC
jgi:hypothetical protein